MSGKQLTSNKLACCMPEKQHIKTSLLYVWKTTHQTIVCCMSNNKSLLHVYLVVKFDFISQYQLDLGEAWKVKKDLIFVKPLMKEAGQQINHQIYLPV